MTDRGITDRPALAPETRERMVEAIYTQHYANIMPRAEFDQRAAALSDLRVADAAYESLYRDKLPREQFNERVGLTSARGSTQAAVVQGATLGLSDEVGAAAAGLGAEARRLFTGEGPRFSEAYAQTRDAQRENMEVFRQNNPYIGRGLEFVGGMASLGPAQQAATSLPRIAATSGLLGATAGFGMAEGGLADRAESAAFGGAVGAGAGVALPLVLRAGSGIIGRVARMAGLGNDETTAQQLLVKALRDDGLTPDDIAGRLQQWVDDGAKPAALFDLGGENTRRLARTAAGRTGPATERATAFLAERQGGQAARIAGDVTETLGQNADDFFTRTQQLIQQRSQSARPRYEAAFSRIRVEPQEYTRLQPFIRDPIGQDALQRGLRVVELEHLAEGRAFNPATYGVTRGQDGRFVLQEGRVPNLRLLDAVKRGFDEIVEGFRDPTSGRLSLNQYGRAVNDARASYTGQLREMFPRYGSALDAWAGPSRALDALSQGRNILTMRDEEVARLAAELRNDQGTMEFFRLGATQSMRDAIMRAPDGADAVKRIFGSPQKRNLLRAAFPTETEFNRFASRMGREADLYRNAQFVSPRTGSQTQMRTDDAGQFGDMALDALAATVIPGQSPAGAVGRWASNRMAGARGVTPGVAGQLGEMMFTGDPAQVQAAIRALRARELANAQTAATEGMRSLTFYPRLAAALNAYRQD